jgi:putative membrane protein
MWGAVIAHSRLLVGSIVEHCNHEPECRDNAIGWVVGHAIALKEDMRESDAHFEYEEIVGFLSPEQFECLASSKHPCLYALTELRFALKTAFAVSADTPAALGFSHTSEMRMMEQSMDALQLNMGGLERVRSTPLPIMFVAHLRTFMMLYLLSLPYLYGHTWGYGTIPSVFLTAYALLGIDGSASECESPFKKRPNHLDMEGYCLITMENVEQILNHNHDLQQKRLFA